MLNELKNVTTGHAASNRSESTPPVAAATPKPQASPTQVLEEEQAGKVSSPRIKVDPAAGVILQFLDNKGAVETQTPSFVAVAYLRAGLTRDGSPADKKDEAPTPPITA